MKHALYRSSFNTDEHHYCSTDNEILKDESTLIILIIMLLAMQVAFLLYFVFDIFFLLLMFDFHHLSPHISSPLQILTQEDWNAVLYNGMASTTPLAALYFVALMTFGNYVLFNLLVAILVEGFQAEVRAKMHLF